MADTFTYATARAVVTATVAIFHQRMNGEWLTFLGKRSMRCSAFPGLWCMPGGKLEAKSATSPGETVEETALREVEEEASIRLRPDQLCFIRTSSGPSTDPRGHFVNIVYYAVADDRQFAAAAPGSDLETGGWCTLEETYRKTFAFDHKVLLEEANRRVRGWDR